MSKGMNKGLYPWRAQLLGAGFLAGAYFGRDLSPSAWFTATFVVIGVLGAVVRPWYWLSRGRHGAKAYVSRHERKQERSDGTMSRYDHMKNFSRTAMRVRWARELQPQRDLGEGSFGALLRNPVWEIRCWIRIFWEPVTAYSRPLGISNLGRKFLPHNAHNLRISGPRSGKSEGLHAAIIDHQGPVVATSTRSELIHITQVLRENIGPTYIFNAGDVGGIPSNLKWSVLSGCKDMRTARRRAADLMGQLAPGDAGNWQEKAVNVLGPLMYLAAHKGADMTAVERWIAVGSQAASETLFFDNIQPWILELKDRTGRLSLGGLQLFYATNDKTRTSISSSLGPILSWIGDPIMHDLGNSRNVDFDVEERLLDPNATIYILGGGEQGDGASALMRALVAEIVYRARKVAEKLPGGRLSPALFLALDEVPLTCPGPVPKWVADMGGRGIILDMVVQARGQLDEIWGHEGRKTIMTGCHTTLFGAGCNSSDVVQDFALLSGTRTELRNSYDGDGNLSGSTEMEVPVLDPGKIVGLQVGESIFLCRGRVDVVKTPRAKTRRDVRRVLAGGGGGGPRRSRFGRMSEESEQAQAEFEQDLQGGRV